MQLKQLKITWNKKKIFGKTLLHFTHKKKTKKKNTNAIISSLLTYIMRRLLLNYLLTMLTLKKVLRNLIINKGDQVVFSQLTTCKYNYIIY